MRDRARIVAVASVVVVALGAAALWIGAPKPPVDAPPAAARPFPAPEHWPGVRWQRVDAPVLEGAGTFLNEVTSHGPWIVGWGGSTVPDPAAEGGVRSMSTLFTSNAGVDWQRREIRLATGEPFEPQLIAVGPVGFLAFGLRSGGNDVGLVAASANGEHWVETGQPPVPPGSPLTATRTDFVTTGVVAGRPVVLSTSDGSAWAELPAPFGLGEYSLVDLRPTLDGFVVAGMVQRGQDWDGVIWRSASAGAWDDLAGDNPMFTGPDRGVAIWRTVPFAGGIFAMGGAGEIPECQLGTARVAALTPVIADHCGGPPAAAWASPDGRQWQEVEGPRPPGARLDRWPVIISITAGAAGLVALVEEAPVRAGASVHGLWTSADGVDWSRIGDGAPIEPTSGSVTIVGLPGRIVALVRTGDGIVVWMGTPAG
ncbi:MAG TPA: hypothetical protein VGQ58_01505 [Candidatus Limnocylindrales bacterium]|nr:hypothetical protein [Candidatus Limnocylindrales bacterium]